MGCDSQGDSSLKQILISELQSEDEEKKIMKQQQAKQKELEKQKHQKIEKPEKPKFTQQQGLTNISEAEEKHDTEEQVEQIHPTHVNLKNYLQQKENNDNIYEAETGRVLHLNMGFNTSSNINQRTIQNILQNTEICVNQ